MSFGIFEAATADDLNDNHRKRLATTRLAQAAAEVDNKLGPMLAKSTSVADYHDRVRLAEKDFREIVGKYLEGDSGFTAVAKKLEPHYTQKRSRRKTSGEYLEPGDLDDNRAQFFFEQFADSAGIDTYGGDYDRIWNDIKESVDYDVISDGLDAAIQSGELSSSVGARLQWDLEAFNGLGSGARFSSKTARRRQANNPLNPYNRYEFEDGNEVTFNRVLRHEDRPWEGMQGAAEWDGSDPQRPWYGVVGRGAETPDRREDLFKTKQEAEDFVVDNLKSWEQSRFSSKRPASRRKRSAGPPGFAFDRAEDNFDSDLGGVPGRATNLQGESVEFGDFDSFIDGLTFEWSNVEVGSDEAGQVLVDTWDASSGYSDQFVVEASRRKRAYGEDSFYVEEFLEWYAKDGLDPSRDKVTPADVQMWAEEEGYNEWVAQGVAEFFSKTARRRRSSRRKRANGLAGEYYVDDQTGYAIEVEDHGGSDVGVIYDPNGREIDSIHPGGGYQFEDMHELMGGFDYFLQDSMDNAEKFRRDFHSRRKRANPWESPDDALGSGYFPGWQTDHNEDGWWQINSPDGSDALVGEGDGSYTMRMDAETPEEAWAERMNFDEALQESEALHYRKNGSRRRAGQTRTAQRRGLRRR